MAEYLIQDTTLTAIGDAIRTKTEKTNLIPVSGMADEILQISSGAELNFEVVGGTTKPANPIENTIWVNTENEITSWIFSATEPYGNSLVISANHSINSSSTKVSIVDNSNNAIIASQTVTGTTYYSVFTDVVISFTTADGSKGTLTCSVRQNTTPFFVGTVVVDGVAVGTVSIGTGTNSSYAWNGAQTISYTKNSAEDGMVWIVTSAVSDFEFNALKKNAVQVYPNSLKQYVSGEWVEKPTELYQNGAWTQFIDKGYLYYYSQQSYEWEAVAQKCVNASNNAAVAPVPYYNSDGSVKISFTPLSGSRCSGIFWLAEDFDLTNYSTLEISLGECYKPSVQIMLVVTKRNTYWGTDSTYSSGTAYAYLNITTALSNTIQTLDVSGISGEKCIGIGFNEGSACYATMNYLKAKSD